MARPFLVLALASFLVSVAGENSTLKKRRGRPKKVTEEKAVTTTCTTVVTVPSPTGTTLDEYETWFDKSGWWHEANKTRTPGTTKKQRTKKSRAPKFTTTEAGVLLEQLYYSLKQHYKKPENKLEADHLVRDIIKKHDEEKGISEHYTWVDLDPEADGSMQNSEIRRQATMANIDISDF